MFAQVAAKSSIQGSGLGCSRDTSRSLHSEVFIVISMYSGIFAVILFCLKGSFSFWHNSDLLCPVQRVGHVLPERKLFIALFHFGVILVL